MLPNRLSSCSAPRSKITGKALIAHGADLHAWHAEYRDANQEPPPGYDHNEVVRGMKDESKWFVAQPDAMTKKFEPYLDLSRL